MTNKSAVAIAHEIAVPLNKARINLQLTRENLIDVLIPHNRDVDLLVSMFRQRADRRLLRVQLSHVIRSYEKLIELQTLEISLGYVSSGIDSVGDIEKSLTRMTDARLLLPHSTEQSTHSEVRQPSAEPYAPER
jgi:hypothetical protein